MVGVAQAYGVGVGGRNGLYGEISSLSFPPPGTSGLVALCSPFGHPTCRPKWQEAYSRAGSKDASPVMQLSYARVKGGSLGEGYFIVDRI